MSVQPPGPGNLPPPLPQTNPIYQIANFFPPSNDPNVIKNDVLNFMHQVEDYYAGYRGNLAPSERGYIGAFFATIKEQLGKIASLDPSKEQGVNSVYSAITDMQQQLDTDMRLGKDSLMKFINDYMNLYAQIANNV